MIIKKIIKFFQKYNYKFKIYNYVFIIMFFKQHYNLHLGYIKLQIKITIFAATYYSLTT